MTSTHFQREGILSLALLVFALCSTESTYAQPTAFNSGSTGHDGALNITAQGVTYFNPKALGLNPTNPNIYNFTTINIAMGATLKFTEEVFHGPVYFLATENVTISGTIDLTGGNGIAGDANQIDRQLSYAGSGGYGGGLSGILGGSLAAEPGNGPGGGAAGIARSTGDNGFGTGGQFTGSQYLVPLIGGSGGGGGAAQISNPQVFGPSGGGGGGAILIASSTTITVNGEISAEGGNEAGSGGAISGGGSGGAIRLVANTINGNGALVVNGTAFQGNGPAISGSGLIRLETFQQGFTGTINGPVLYSTPFGLVLPATPPGSLSVTAVNGVTINANPFSFPDTSINTSSPVVVNIQAQYIPPGTIPTLTVFSGTGADQIIACTPLQGTLQQSTSTATVTFPTGGSRGFVKATW